MKFKPHLMRNTTLPTIARSFAARRDPFGKSLAALTINGNTPSRHKVLVMRLPWAQTQRCISINDTLMYLYCIAMLIRLYDPSVSPCSCYMQYTIPISPT
ncbi:hypothetical protein E2C01_057806 [Portunus trituberculatus]|uniref:Uncharacterized protein n=1 Tax=Portunus trituberculatus TaxID=210409 RepID=A0A5B7H4E0_PORTR|nr:hypothetical protein [Portunus trituberculatus]